MPAYIVIIINSLFIPLTCKPYERSDPVREYRKHASKTTPLIGPGTNLLEFGVGVSGLGFRV